MALYDVFDPTTAHTQTLVDAREAGAAFFALDKTHRPLVTESIDTGNRVLADTAVIGEGERAEFQRRLPLGSGAEKDFRDGYLDALEADATRRLRQLDWAALEAANAHSPKAIDKRLDEDLRQLAEHRPAATVELWRANAPAHEAVPHYADARWHEQQEALRQTTDALRHKSREGEAEQGAEQRQAEQDEAAAKARQVQHEPETTHDAGRTVDPGQAAQQPSGPPAQDAPGTTVTGPEPDKEAREREPEAQRALDAAALRAVEQRREADSEKVRAQLEANAVEQLRVNAQARGRAAPADGGENEVQSDEVFHTAEDDAKPVVPNLEIPADLKKHFMKVGENNYHFAKNPDSLAFTDRGNKLETKNDSPFVADTMVKIALARGWDEIKVTGSESFKREVWLEAASKGMHVKGYQPTDVDRARLEAITKRQTLRDHETSNKVEQIKERTHEAPKTRNQLMAEAFVKEKPAEAVKKYPELAGAYAGVEAQRRRVQAEHLTGDQTKVALDRINKNAAKSIEKGKIPRVEVVEKVEVIETREVREVGTTTNHRSIER